MDRVYEIGVLRPEIDARKMGWTQVEEGFSSFFAKFLPFLMIFQSSTVSSAHSTLKNGKNSAKNKENIVQKLTNETSVNS